MNFFKFGLSLTLFCFSCLSFNSIVSADDNICNGAVCNITSYKRCYDDYSLSSNYRPDQKKCKCLRGLFQTQDGNCIGVIRYEMKFTIFKSRALLNEADVENQIRTLFKNMLNKPYNIIITSKYYEIDLEQTFLTQVENKPETEVFNKLVFWKKSQKNPLDLPSIKLEEIQEFLIYNFEKLYSNETKNSLIENFDIGKTNLKDFISKFTIKYNTLTCYAAEYSYCHEHELCESHLGGVKCRCDLSTSIDVSPQKDLFPGEVCQSGCPKECQHEGLCRYKDGNYVCYCPDLYIGEYCQIHIIWFIIIAISLTVIFCLLACTCGLFEFLEKRNRDKKMELKKKLDEDLKEKRF